MKILTDQVQKDLLTEYPHLKEIIKNYIILKKDDYNSLLNGKKVEVLNKEISVELLKRLLQYPYYYDYVDRLITNEIKSINVSYLIHGDNGGSITINKINLIIGLEKAMINYPDLFTEEDEIKLENIKNKISSKLLMNEYSNAKMKLTIDGKIYIIPFNSILGLLMMSDQEFQDFCNRRSLSEIPNSHLIYATKFFIDKKNIFEEYLFPENVIKRFNDNLLEIIDIQALNTHLETTDTLYNEIELEPELEQHLLTGIPDTADDLEKAIFIYIKMCKTFTYDDEYYVLNQVGERTNKHRELEYVQQLSLANNVLVCYEFNLIYAKLLNKIGLNFSSDYKNLVGEEYGAGHANITFRSGKYIVNADSVVSILQGDLANAKTNLPLNGLKCLNSNSFTQEEFKQKVTKMYELVASIEKQEETTIGQKETFEEIMAEYLKTTTNYRNVDLQTKLNVLFQRVNSKSLIGIDAIAYILVLSKILFDDKERRENVSISVIRSNAPLNPEKESEVNAVIAINERGFQIDPPATKFFRFIPTQGLVATNYTSVQEAFDNGVLEYVKADDHKIPFIMSRQNKGVAK